MAKGDYEMGSYSISDIYSGGSSLIPPNVYIRPGSLGMTTDPRSANVIKEVSEKLSSGAKQIEIEMVSPEIFDSVPRHHFKEVNRLAKLTGVEISLHGPVIDTAGISRQGFSESAREAAERRVTDTLLRSHELNPQGNIIVNFHTAEGILGSQFLPPSDRTKESQYKSMIIINRQTGELRPLEQEEYYSPEQKDFSKPETFSPEKRLNMINATNWDNSISQTVFQKEQIDKIIEESLPLIQQYSEKIKNGQLNPNTIGTNEQVALKHYFNAGSSLHNLDKNVRSLFDNAYQYGDDTAKEALKKISEQFKKIMPTEKDDFDFSKQSDAMQFLINNLKPFVPNMYDKIENFAVEKSSQTYGNAAWESYKKFKDKSPTLVIENPPAGFALSRGEDVANLVKASRNQFVENAVNEGMSKSDAENQAEKFIGATWDVGHINMMKKFGYTDKDIIKESEAVAPLLKHVHLSDNFGMEHTELPMGMGNVPLKEIMAKLGEKGFEAKKIIEAGNWWQHFRTSPFQESLEAMGSPIYGMKMAPYWDKAPGLYQGYFSGYGQMLPQINYETFGSGFSRLPSELGGQTAGAGGSRMSGRPME